MTRWIAALVVLLGLGLLLWPRLAPISADAFHRIDPEPGAAPEAAGFEAVRQVPAPKAVLADLTRIATASESTELLEGSAEEGLVTVVTRSTPLGLPDITNLWIEGDRVHLRGHAAFGLTALGDGRARAAVRIDDWLGRAGLR